MAIELYDGTDHDGLFDLQGKAFKVIKDLNVSRGTTIPADVVAALSSFALLTQTTKLSRIITPIPGAVQGFQSGCAGLLSAMATYVGQLLLEMADADAPLDQRTVTAALAVLIKQMLDNSDSVNASTVGFSIATGSNNGDGKLILSKKRGDGLIQENALAETITVKVTSDDSPATASLLFTGDEAESSRLSQDWPRGSGCSKTLTATDAASSLLSNGDMEDEVNVTDAPDDWIVSVGTIGTTLKMTDVEVQTVAMSGTPTSGYYELNYTNPAGKVQTTVQLAYNASSAAVQAALRLLKGLESVAVVESGTTPNLTHTITFTGAGGDVTQLTSNNHTDSGSIAHATTTAGTAQVYKGSKALWFVSDGSQLTTLNQRLTTLKPETAYALSLWAICDVIPAAGVFTFDLVDGIGGTVIQDAQGANNSLTFNASSLTTGWQHLSALVSGECVFRTPSVLPPLVYLRIRISTAVTNARQVFIDHVSLVEMQELYAGGLLAAVFSGAADFADGDNWTVTVTNDRAGELQEYYQRCFGMSNLGLLLPSNSSGGETIPDSVIS